MLSSTTHFRAVWNKFKLDFTKFYIVTTFYDFRLSYRVQ
jgi:hypothetical protein